MLMFGNFNMLFFYVDVYVSEYIFLFSYSFSFSFLFFFFISSGNPRLWNWGLDNTFGKQVWKLSFVSLDVDIHIPVSGMQYRKDNKNKDLQSSESYCWAMLINTNLFAIDIKFFLVVFWEFHTGSFDHIQSLPQFFPDSLHLSHLPIFMSNFYLHAVLFLIFKINIIIWC